MKVKIRRIALIIAVFSLLFTSISPVYAKRQPLSPLSLSFVHDDWSGFYIGLDVGQRRYALRKDFYELWLSSLLPDLGLFAGYNFQQESWVYGLQCEFDWSKQDFWRTLKDSSGRFHASQYGVGVYGRVGRPFGSILPYLLGGVDYEVENATLEEMRDLTQAGNNRNSKLNFVLGLGAEMAFTKSFFTRLEWRKILLNTSQQQDWLDRSFVDQFIQGLHWGIGIRF